MKLMRQGCTLDSSAVSRDLQADQVVHQQAPQLWRPSGCWLRNVTARPQHVRLPSPIGQLNLPALVVEREHPRDCVGTQGCDEAGSRPSSSPHQAMPATWRQAGVPCALVGTPACGSASSPLLWTITSRRVPARASATSGAAYPQPASPTGTTLPSKYAQSNHRRVRVILAFSQCVPGSIRRSP